MFYIKQHKGRGKTRVSLKTIANWKTERETEVKLLTLIRATGGIYDFRNLEQV
jgi:hypothetical protein